MTAISERQQRSYIGAIAAGLRRCESERRPRQQHLGGDARLVGAKIHGLGVGHRMATLRDDLGRGAGAEQGGHRRVWLRLADNCCLRGVPVSGWVKGSSSAKDG